MSSVFALFTNPYERKARLQPALLSILPLLTMAVVLGFPEQSYASAVIGVLLYGGVAMLLIQVGRDRGKRLEPTLFAQWGGKPSVALLRHRDTRINGPTKQRYRTFLDRAVPDLELPSPELEAQAPDAADAQYDAASDWLVAQTRDRNAYDLLFRENVGYGFRRNLWALRPIGIVADIVILGALTALYGFEPASIGLGATISGSTVAIIALVTALHLAIFSLITTRAWVRIAADAYGRRLLEACDRLHENNLQHFADSRPSI